MSWAVLGAIFLGLLINFLLRRLRPRRWLSYGDDPNVVTLVAQLSAADREHIAWLVRSDRTIGAIQLLRERVPADLRLAKRTVEHLAAVSLQEPVLADRKDP